MSYLVYPVIMKLNIVLNKKMFEKQNCMKTLTKPKIVDFNILKLAKFNDLNLLQFQINENRKIGITQIMQTMIYHCK